MKLVGRCVNTGVRDGRKTPCRYRQAYGENHSLRSRAGLHRCAELFERTGQGRVAVEGFQARFFGESFDSLMKLSRNVSEARFEDVQNIFPQNLEPAFLPAFLNQLFSQCHDILLEFTDIQLFQPSPSLLVTRP